jgi:uncharacterized RDD family membrane protein YckC
MQCAACRAVYSNGLEICPRCKRPASSASSRATASEKTVATDKKAAPRKASRATSGGAAASAAHASEAAASRAAADGSATSAVADEPASPASTASSAASASTLIEFPGTARNRPQWRKDLSERVREIQARRAREAALESESATSVRAERANAPSGEATPHATSAEAQATPQLGLVPPAETPEMNPIVAAALRRIERARQTPPPVTRSSGRGAAATAVARVVEEQYETQAETVAESASSARADSQAHASGLVVISAAPSVKAEATPDAATVAQQGESPKVFASVPQVEPVAPPSINPPAQTGKAILTSETAPSRTTEEKRVEDSSDVAARETKPLPRRVANPIIDDSTLTRLEAEILPPVVSAKDAFDDRAPLVSRFVAALLDLFVVVFLVSPCAAIIELTSGNWSDPRVAATMSAIFILVMFLYQTGATALAGRTLGMRLLSLHTVDAETALSPTTRQSVRRALVYMLSLVTFGLGLIYSLFDAEGRAAHDHLSGTVVVRE